jgi:hypothetical protein
VKANGRKESAADPAPPGQPVVRLDFVLATLFYLHYLAIAPSICRIHRNKSKSCSAALMQWLKSLATRNSEELKRVQEDKQVRLGAVADTAMNKLEEELKSLSTRHAEGLSKVQCGKD